MDKYEPLPRWGHTSATIGDKVYIWGGRIDDFSESSKKRLASVVEVYVIQDEIWEQKKTKGTPPLGLYNNAFAVIGSDLYVYGGWDGHSAHNNLHRLNVDTLTWEEARSKDEDDLPMEMSGCGLVANGNDKLVLFGGYGLPSASGTPKKKGNKVNLVTKSSKTVTQTQTPVFHQETTPSLDSAQFVDSDTPSDDKEKNGDVPTNGEVVINGEEAGGEEAGGEEAGGDVDKNEEAEDIKKVDWSISLDLKEEEEKDESDVSLINKQWTNELKVYNINSGEWISPEVSGDCPPPCVDFSFDCIDGRRAILFGGYRPESGASSGAYILDMEMWSWTKIGDHESHRGKFDWPIGRDGHASCVLSETPFPQILISGGWDKDNRLINDAWILNIHAKSWKKFPLLDAVGPRLWHRVVSYQHSPNFRQLLFFGGCPGAPMDASGGSSWAKLASTILVEMGLVKKKGSVATNDYKKNSFSHRSGYQNEENEWVAFESLDMSLMGEGQRRLKERVLFAEYKAKQAEIQAQKAEKLARDALNKLEGALSRMEKGTRVSSPPFSFYKADSMTSVNSVTSVNSMKPATPKEDKPFWAIPLSALEFTSEEVGRGKWGVVKIAYHKGERVATRCLYSRIISEDNRKVFIESMDIASKMRHPNILPFIGAVLEGEPIIVTELMPLNLKKVLSMGKLQNYQTINIAFDIANALLFLHTTRPDPVIHGDLTSTNILLQKQGGNQWRAKISDFMTAKFFHKIITSDGMDSDRESSMSPTNEAPVLTSPRQTPPPLSHSSKRLSASEMSISRRLSSRKQSQTAPDMLDPTTLTLQRDIYSFGLLLVEMCTGTPPLEVSLQFLAESITWTDISAVVKTCTQHDPAKRPTATIVVGKLKVVHRATVSKPSKFNVSYI